MNYDPNLTNSGKMAVQTVKLTFASWEYRAERTVEVGGTCKGFSVIESAVYRAWEGLEFDQCGNVEYANITLTDSKGEELICEDDDDRGEDWLKDMLISAEIISIIPEPA